MKIYEIGVGEPNVCRTTGYQYGDFRGTEHECVLFEPNPDTFFKNREQVRGHANYKIYNCAVGGETKPITFFLAGDSSFVEGIKSPEVNHKPDCESFLSKVDVIMVDMESIDPGDIDILLLDCEGSEFNVLKNMKSRPSKILIEMESKGVGYINPFFNEIIEWMNINNYTKSGENFNGEDYIFDKKTS
jgi:FkbM family methyltransferase